MKTSSDSIASASASSSTKPRNRTVLIKRCPWLDKQGASDLLSANAGDLEKAILQAQAKKPRNDVIELSEDDDNIINVSAATTTIAKKKSSPSSGASSSDSSNDSILSKGSGEY